MEEFSPGIDEYYMSWLTPAFRALDSVVIEVPHISCLIWEDVSYFEI